MRSIYAAILLLFVTSYSQAQSLTWAGKIGGKGQERVFASAVDAAGNVYVAGNYYDTLVFESMSAPTLPGKGLVSDDVFIAKYSTSGDCLWAKSIGSKLSDNVNELTVDGAGNIYITGNFKDTMDFDPGAGVANLVSSGGDDAYFAKYDNNGNYLWARSIGAGAGFLPNEAGQVIQVDGAGNVYVSGTFSFTVDFNPDPLITANLTSGGNNDIFFAKYDSNGNYLWARSFGGSSSETCADMKLDNSGNLILAGIYFGTVDFDPGTGLNNLVSAGAGDAYVAKYSSNGDYVWAVSAGGVSGDRVTALATDATNNIYITGTVGNAATFGTIVLPSSGSTDMYYAKINPGGTFLWCKGLSGTVNEAPDDIAVDATGNIILTGIFSGTLDFDPTSTVNELAVGSVGAMFISRYDHNGNYLWAGVIAGGNTYNVYTANVDNQNNLYLGGRFSSTADFDMSGTAAPKVSAGTTDGFIAKYNLNVPLAVSLLRFTAVPDGNEVQTRWTVAAEKDNSHFEVEKSADAETYITAGSVHGCRRCAMPNEYVFQDKHPFEGTSYYRLKLLASDGTISYSPIAKVIRNILSNTASVFPNPTDGKSVVILSVPSETRAFFQINDINGRKHLGSPVVLRTGVNEIPFNISDLPRGVYTVSILSEDGSWTPTVRVIRQ